jgi:hypothetical protein
MTSLFACNDYVIYHNDELCDREPPQPFYDALALPVYRNVIDEETGQPTMSRVMRRNGEDDEKVLGTFIPPKAWVQMGAQGHAAMMSINQVSYADVVDVLDPKFKSFEKAEFCLTTFYALIWLMRLQDDQFVQLPFLVPAVTKIVIMTNKGAPVKASPYTLHHLSKVTPLEPKIAATDLLITQTSQLITLPYNKQYTMEEEWCQLIKMDNHKHFARFVRYLKSCSSSLSLTTVISSSSSSSKRQSIAARNDEQIDEEIDTRYMKKTRQRHQQPQGGEVLAPDYSLPTGFSFGIGKLLSYTIGRLFRSSLTEDNDFDSEDDFDTEE